MSSENLLALLEVILCCEVISLQLIKINEKKSDFISKHVSFYIILCSIIFLLKLKNPWCSYWSKFKSVEFFPVIIDQWQEMRLSQAL